MQREMWIYKSCQIESNLDCDYTFPIDLPPNGIPFGGKLVDGIFFAQNLLIFFMHFR